MKPNNFLLLLLFLLLVHFANSQAPFTAGNIVVVRVGEGISPSYNIITAPVFLDEYTPSGTLIQSIPLPTAASGNNKALTLMDVHLDNTGLINLSVDGQYLLLAGYSASPGVFSPDGASATIMPRTIAVIKYDGTINTTTALTDYQTFGEPTSVVSTNGIDLWCNGTNFNANGTQGIRYATIGSTTSTQLITSPASSVGLSITDGKLYFSYGGGPSLGTVGTGLPTTSGQTVQAVPGFPTSTNFNRIKQFVFFDMNPAVPGADVLYVANQRSNGGLQKFSLVNEIWELNGTIGPGSDGYIGLAARLSEGTVSLFATRKGNNSLDYFGGELVTLTDATGYNGTLSGTPTVLAAVETMDTKRFLGVALVPQPLPACALSLPVITDVTLSSAAISWPSKPGVAGYEYAITTGSTPPVSGTTTTDVSTNATGLTNNTKYYVHLRTNCGNFNYSSWSIDSFVTGCKAPAAPLLSITNLTSSGSADINWNSVSGAASYEYAITTSNAPPSSGTAITGTSVHATGLHSVTTYYVHVRSDCGSGFYSPWTSKAFNTSCLSPVVSLTPRANNMAEVKWNSLNGASSYQVALTTNLIPPYSGTATTDTMMILTDLTPGAGYYFHVRSNCSENGYSEWTTYNFYMPGIDAYPNPVKNTMTVRLSGVKNTGVLSIYNSEGRRIKAITVSNDITTVDMKGMPSGIYLIKYMTGNEKYTVKVLKQ